MLAGMRQRKTKGFISQVARSPIPNRPRWADHFEADRDCRLMDIKIISNTHAKVTAE